MLFKHHVIVPHLKIVAPSQLISKRSLILSILNELYQSCISNSTSTNLVWTVPSTVSFCTCGHPNRYHQPLRPHWLAWPQQQQIAVAAAAGHHYHVGHQYPATSNWMAHLLQPHLQLHLQHGFGVALGFQLGCQTWYAAACQVPVHRTTGLASILSVPTERGLKY